MSQITSVQCLFCQQLNPSDADYCHACDGQMNLQPCYRCGAVDHRTAKNCYKCGTEFSLPPAPGLDFRFTPDIVGKDRVSPIKSGPGAAAAHAGQLNAGMPPLQPERHRVDEVFSPQIPATAAKSRRGTPVAVISVVLLLVTAAVSAYIYRRPAAQPAQTQGQNEPVIDVPVARKPLEAAPSDEAASKNIDSKPMDAVQTRKASVKKPVETSGLRASGTDAALAERPLPPTDVEVKAFQDPLTVEKCPPAVATLGLCNPDAK